MLQIKNIHKKYITGDLTQEALNDVSFNLRDSEFVAVLGQSGSGKTTLLNIIGGLDRYDSGDIVINSISTKKYSDRDWDSYRNHTIGFVFQSYNLIPHQSVLSNVELALTISGISSGERKKRAQEALEKVGLGAQMHKRPNQMSGGQMQRVAIARALVNDPDILLADEPTGALDSETSVQVMDLLREVAKDRLVVMVTHNSELADEYANRIIRLHDGRILDDTNPYEVDDSKLAPAAHKNMGKSSMSFLTSLALSFNNLRTKKGRTFLTAFAGSIGIIGIALILSLSTGVNEYINSIQKETMISYPISIDAQSFDLSSIMEVGRETANTDVEHDFSAVYSNPIDMEMASSISASIKENNLTPFKEYLDDPDSEINQYLGENGIIYSYDVKFDAYTYDQEGELVNTDGSTFEEATSSFPGMNMSSMSSMSGMMGLSGNFTELLPGANDTLVSAAVTDNYEVLYGSWPQKYDEVILALDENNEISTSALYELGLLPAAEYKEILKKIDKGEDFEIATHNWSYEDICKQTFYMVPASDYYVENEHGLFDDLREDEEKLTALIESSVQLKIVGIVRPAEDASYTSISSAVGYTSALTDYVITHTSDSPVVKAQEADTETNVLNGLAFVPEDDEERAKDAMEYITSMAVEDKAAMSRELMRAASMEDPQSAETVLQMTDEQIAAVLDQSVAEAKATGEYENILLIYDTYLSPGSFDDNMTDFGVVSLDAPSSISIYADKFEDKDAISASIDAYNITATQENQITYTDYVGLLMSSVTTIINVISYVLIAFVAVSLVVSSIMIGIITYISVLERTKEIGILRAIGASKGNISQVFNAETFIVGLISGLLGIGITLLLLIPTNGIIHAVTGTTAVNAALPLASALVLIGLSMLLTLIAGLIPSRKAAKKDPVIALRSE